MSSDAGASGAPAQSLVLAREAEARRYPQVQMHDPDLTMARIGLVVNG